MNRNLFCYQNQFKLLNILRLNLIKQRMFTENWMYMIQLYGNKKKKHINNLIFYDKNNLV